MTTMPTDGFLRVVTDDSRFGIMVFHGDKPLPGLQSVSVEVDVNDPGIGHLTIKALCTLAAAKVAE